MGPVPGWQLLTSWTGLGSWYWLQIIRWVICNVSSGKLVLAPFTSSSDDTKPDTGVHTVIQNIRLWYSYICIFYVVHYVYISKLLNRRPLSLYYLVVPLVCRICHLSGGLYCLFNCRITENWIWDALATKKALFLEVLKIVQIREIKYVFDLWPSFLIPLFLGHPVLSEALTMITTSSTSRTS